MKRGRNIMRFGNPNNPQEPVTIDAFLVSGEYDQGDVALVSYDDLYDYLDVLSKALDKADVAIGNEHKTYSLKERIEWLAAVKDTFMRQVDELRTMQADRFRNSHNEASARRKATNL